MTTDRAARQYETSQLSTWFNTLPERDKYKFVAHWKQREAGSISNEKLINNLSGKHHGSDHFIKKLLCFDLSLNKFKNVKRNKRGILLEDIEQLCQSINSVNKKSKPHTTAALSADLFYQHAWIALGSQYPVSENGGLGTITTAESEIITALKQLAHWSRIAPILHLAPEIDVDTLYVELRLMAEQNKIFSNSVVNPNPANDFKFQIFAGHYIHAESLLTRISDRCIIVGPPGSGKSTFLKWAFTYLLKSEGKLGVPVPVQLKAFSDYVAMHPNTSIWEFVYQRQLKSRLPNKLAASDPLQIKPTHIVYLLDGWDEVPIKLRSPLKALIDRDTENTKTIITSRQSGIPAILRAGQTEFYELGPLTDYTVAELCLKYGTLRKNTLLINDLLALLERTPSLWSIAANPYLLTLLCEVVFARGMLPEFSECSAHWVLTQAKNLMLADHNQSHPNYPLTQDDESKLEDLAYQLCFSYSEKLANFTPLTLKTLWGNVTQHRNLLNSRFFNGFTNSKYQTQFEFSHLRLQEYFAAAAFAKQNLAPLKNAIKRLLYSTAWQSELGHIAALLAEPWHNQFWEILHDALQQMDEAGEILRRVAGVLCTAGISAGGETVMGLDIRPLLWQRVTTEELFIKPNLIALLNLDAGYLAQHLEQIMVLKPNLPVPASHIIEQAYRLLPYEIRRHYIDIHLAHSQTRSWMPGLPAKAFPALNRLENVLQVALDESSLTSARIAALQELGASRAMLGATSLIPLMQHSNEQIAANAIEALSKIGGHEIAVAMADLLITQQNLPASFKGALLNGLAIGGYGIIEAQSRDRLLAALETAQNNAQQEDLLNALSGAPLPEIPKCVYDIISAKNADHTAVAAASLLSGVCDTDFLSTALILVLKRQIAEAVSIEILHSCPFIPLGFEHWPALWQHFHNLPAHTREKIYLLLLFIKTATRFPNHPAASTLRRYLHTILQQQEQTDEQLFCVVISNARLLITEPGCTQLLLRIIKQEAASENARAAAVNALIHFRLSEPIKSDLILLFKQQIQHSELNYSLVEALTTTLFCIAPGIGPSLLKLAAMQRESVNKLVRRSVLTAANDRGYLIFKDCIATPSGEILAQQIHDAMAETKNPS